LKEPFLKSFHDPVFQRMKCNHGDVRPVSIILETCCNISFQRPEFIIHFDTQGPERRCAYHLFGFPTTALAMACMNLAGAAHSGRFPLMDDQLRQCFGIRQFTIFLKELMQLLLAILIYDSRCS
jgi:hypothetical protein